MEFKPQSQNGYKLLASRFLKWLVLGDEYSNTISISRS